MRNKTSQLQWLVRLGCAVLLSGLVACNAKVDGAGDNNDGGMSTDGGLPGPKDFSFDSDAFWASDPPPMICPKGGMPQPQPNPPGGTPECPDDKNRQGCPCKTEGEQQPCWPGLRANRSLGSCQDGVTKCVRNGEFGYVWGACEGAVLPVQGGSGKDACNCFSAGQWALENLSPCFYTDGMGKLTATTSTIITAGKPACEMMSGTIKKPSQPWSPNTITVDCAGHWKLCYSLKAGDAKDPKPTDCVINTVCTEGDYDLADKVQALPVLPAWIASTPAQVTCAEKFRATGGYGEMSVDGKSVRCDTIQKVFNRVNYCPATCNTNPMAPECKNCNAGGSGSF